MTDEIKLPPLPDSSAMPGEYTDDDMYDYATAAVLADRQARGVTPAMCEAGHAHFTPRYLISNCRRIAAPEYQRLANWALAANLFAVGRTVACSICREAGIDPDGYDVRPAQPSPQAVAADQCAGAGKVTRGLSGTEP